MKTNEGSLDRIIRVLVGVLLIVLFLIHTFSATLGIILLIVGGVLLLTGLVGTCPIYSIFGISSCKTKATTEENK